MANDRATSAVVGKALEAALVVLYVGLLAATLYGGVVPEYRTAAGEEVGERVLATAALKIQQAVPADAYAVEARMHVELPTTIRGQTYEILVDGRSLALTHTHRDVSQSTPLALPETVAGIEGVWISTEPAVIVVEKGDEGLSVRLKSEAG